MGEDQKDTTKMGNKNRSELNLIPDLLRVISLWRLPLLPPNLPTIVATVFNKQNNIGWLQSLTVILAHKWVETHNAYLIYLGAKVTGQRWVSTLIIIL